MKQPSYAWKFFVDQSGGLVLGALIALVLANVNAPMYHALVHLPLLGSTAHFVVNDMLMALFFALAAKEITEAVALPGGSLRELRQAGLPLMATAGGMIGPATIFLLLCLILGQDELARGWAIPCATDIAFSAMVASFLFGHHKVAMVFLLTIAVADDFGGIMALAIFYPTGDLDLIAFFTFVIPAVVAARLMTHFGVKSWLLYLAGPGVVSWIGFNGGGIHPALAFVPIVFVMPHAARDLGWFVRGEMFRHDALSEMEHAAKPVVACILFLFGLLNTGVEFGNVGAGTFIVASSLMLGKPIGIYLFTKLGLMMGLKMPTGLTIPDVKIVGIVAGIGFTVALFVTNVAFNGTTVPSADVDALKMGALLSFASAGVAVVYYHLIYKK